LCLRLGSEMLEQPKEYVRSLRLANAKCIIITDGANLFVYARRGQEWLDSPVGYLNVGSLQKQIILPKGTNLIGTLVMLQPSSV